MLQPLFQVHATAMGSGRGAHREFSGSNVAHHGSYILATKIIIKHSQDQHVATQSRDNYAHLLFDCIFVLQDNDCDSIDNSGLAIGKITSAKEEQKAVNITL